MQYKCIEFFSCLKLLLTDFENRNSFITASQSSDIIIFIFRSKYLINLSMYADNLDCPPKSIPLIYRKSPIKYVALDQKYPDVYNPNKTLTHNPAEDWSFSDFHNIRKVNEDVGSLRQTVDGKSHSKIQQILSKYQYDNDQLGKNTSKTDNILRQSYNPRSRQPEYRQNLLNVPESFNGYSNNIERVRSPARNEKYEFDIGKYKQQLEQLETTKKMAELLRKLKQDRRKRMEAGVKETISNAYKQQQQIGDFKRNKDKTYEEFYSPKYEKIDITQNLEISKTVPLKKLNLDRYKTKSDDRPETYLLNNIEEEEQSIYKSKSLVEDSSDLYLSPTRAPSKPTTNSKQISSGKLPSKNGSRKGSSNLGSLSSFGSYSSSLIDEFTIGKFLGQGRFGSVFQVFHKPTGALFAMKKIPKQNVKKLNMVNQLILELKIQTFLHHQNIVTLYHSFDDASYIYLILEYMQQGPLFSLLKKKKTLSQDDVAQKMKQIASAIKYMQDNQIAHRDIKPQNIVMTHGVCKICDFGWATICQNRRRTCCGTLDYTPPQIFEGAQYDETVDLWCLGVLTYQLLVGKAPFYHIRRQQTKNRIMNVEKTAINYPENLSKKSISFMQSLMKKDPKQRLSSQALLDHPFLQIPEEDI